MEYVIAIKWDSDAAVWIATSGSRIAQIDFLCFRFSDSLVVYIRAARSGLWLMAEYEKKVRVKLVEHGCSFVRRGKGDHDIWYSPISARYFAFAKTLKKH